MRHPRLAVVKVGLYGWAGLWVVVGGVAILAFLMFLPPIFALAATHAPLPVWLLVMSVWAVPITWANRRVLTSFLRSFADGLERWDLPLRESPADGESDDGAAPEPPSDGSEPE